MNTQERIIHNVKSWNLEHILACTGYAKGEVLPYKTRDKTHSLQRRVLDYLHGHPGAILLTDAVEAQFYIATLGLPSRAEVLGAWHDQCVYHLALGLLEQGTEVRIRPSLTIGKLELAGIEPEDTARKEDWLLKNIVSQGYGARREGEALVFRPRYD